MSTPFAAVLLLVLGVLAGCASSASEGWTVVDMKKDWKVVYPFQK